MCLCLIKASCKLIVSYPLRTHNENEKCKKNKINDMYNETIQPPETNCTIFLLGPSLLGARFARGPSLSGAEMSRNHL